MADTAEENGLTITGTAVIVYVRSFSPGRCSVCLLSCHQSSSVTRVTPSSRRKPPAPIGTTHSHESPSSTTASGSRWS
jgi:hypothetical protein